jgi:simple sugar transport system ATP-binding protein
MQHQFTVHYRAVTAAAPLLDLRDITKRFPGVTANDAVTLELHAGEVLALLGENGAGKSTLVSILYGLYRPDEGEIRLEGRAVQITSPAHALKLGIGLVPQHPVLVAKHTVAENLALGAGGGWLPAQRLIPRIRALEAQYGLKVDPLARVHQLSPGEKQRVEILRSLLGGARVLILDEPTSVLTPQEAEALFSVMRGLRADGKSLVFISHKLDEVLGVADRITVLRRGRVVGNLQARDATKAQLAELMVGRSVSFERKRVTPKLEGELLEVANLRANSARGLEALRDVSFSVRHGEVLGVAGVAGNGQSELIEVLAGLRAKTAGTVRLEGQPLEGTPAERYARGVAHIPEDRIHMGTVPSMSVAENLALRDFQRAPLAKGLWRDTDALERNAQQQVSAYSVATPSIHTPSRLLSGGNIQKVILARELAHDARLVLAVHPTYGLDIGATDQVHRALLERAQAGAGVLIVGEDLDELLMLCDRIAVLVHGELRGPFAVNEVSRQSLGLLMTGAAAPSVAEAEVA